MTAPISAPPLLDATRTLAPQIRALVGQIENDRRLPLLLLGEQSPTTLLSRRARPDAACCRGCPAL